MSTRIALYDASGPLTDFIQKLSGNEGEQWLRDFKRFLRRENPWNPRDWAVWKTIKLALHKDAAAYQKALAKLGNEVSDWSKDIMGKEAFTVSREQLELELVITSVAELGFKQGATYAEICARALELGLDLCPAEVGPALREAYQDQPNGEWLIIAMEAITDSDGGLRVFSVERYDDGARYLNTSNGHPDRGWRADDRFVFLRRK